MAWARCIDGMGAVSLWSAVSRRRRGGDLWEVPGPRRRAPGPGERLEPPERSVSKAARRNSFCFAAGRGRRRLGPGPRVCRESVSSFGARRAPAFAFQELNEKFFGAGFIQERTPCAGGACRPGYRCACVCPAPPATRRGPSWRRGSWTAPGGGHWCSFLWAAELRPLAAQSRATRPREDSAAFRHPAVRKGADREGALNLLRLSSARALMR